MTDSAPSSPAPIPTPPQFVPPAGMPDPSDEAALMAWAQSPEGIAAFARMSDFLVAQADPQRAVAVKAAPVADATST